MQPLCRLISPRSKVLAAPAAALGLALLFLAAPPVRQTQAKGEYTGKYLYGQTSPDEKGGIVAELAAGSPPVVLAVAVGRRARVPFKGRIEGQTVRFDHLPTDLYDLLLVGQAGFWEGIRLAGPGTPPSASERAAIEAEMRKVEAFFEGKELHRVDREGTEAVLLVQQWRVGVALAESGARLAGTIHSLDIFWFEKPKQGWQLVKRRQLYRDEIPLEGPLKHHFEPKLSKIRVTGKVRTRTGIRLSP